MADAEDARSARQRRAAALHLLCALVAPFVLDGLLAYRAPRSDLDARVATARRLGVPFDRRTPLARFEDLVREAPTAAPLLTPLHVQLELDGKPAIPAGAISRAETVLCNEGGEYAVFRSDEHGFNNPEGVHDRPADVVLLGGSYVHGACVGPEATIGAQLRAAGLGVVNLGMSDTGPLTQLATLVEYGASIRPNVVVWMFDRTDFDDLATELHAPVLKSYLVPGFSQHLAERQPEIDAGLRRNAEAKLREARARGDLDPKRDDIVDLLLLRHLRSAVRKPDVSTNVAILEDVLRRGSDLARGWGGQVLLVYLPDFAETGPLAKPMPAHAPYVEVTQRVGLPLLDLLPVFQSQPDVASLFPLRMRGHYTPAGYGMVAANILERLRQLRTGSR